MPTPFRLFRRLLMVLLTGIPSLAQAQDNFLQVMPMVQDPNFSGILADIGELTRQTSITILNKTACPIRVESIAGSLESLDRSVRIATNSKVALLQYKEVANFQAGATMLLAGELDGLFQSTDFSISPNVRQENGAYILPEGDYRFCVSLYGPLDRSSRPTCPEHDLNVPLNLEVNSCTMVRVNSYTSPTINRVLLPTNGSSVSTSGETLTVPNVLGNPGYEPIQVLWSPAVGGNGSNPLYYDLYVMEIDPDDQTDPNQAFNAVTGWSSGGANTAPRILIIPARAPNQLNFTFQPGDMPSEGFKLGYRYVFAVRARTADPNQQINIQNNGNSPIFSFQNGQVPVAAGTGGPFSITQEFPRTGDAIPWIGIPWIVKYAPYKNEYGRFKTQLFIEDKNGPISLQDHGETAGASHQGNEYIRRMNWERFDSPLAAQNYSLQGAQQTADNAQLIAVNPNAFNSTAAGDIEDFKRFPDRQVFWKVTGEMKDKDNGSISGRIYTDTKQSSFIAGMGRPVPLEPLRNTNVSPGSITFRFKTCNPPTNNGLPRNIFQTQAGSAPNFPIMIDETAVLEISTNQNFVSGSVITQNSFRVNHTFVNPLLTSVQPLIDAAYHDETYTTTITQPGTYYWRVRWLTDPMGDANGLSYAISEHIPFTIGVGGDTPVAAIPAEPTPVPNNCDEICNLPLPSDIGSEAIRVDQLVSLGAFSMKITEITLGGSTANGYGGTGIITNFRDTGTSTSWPAEVKVAFSGLKVNQAGTAFAGEANATGGGTQTSFEQLLAAGGQALGTGAGGPLKVPFGWNEAIDGVKVALLLDSIKFTPQKAVAAVKIGYDINKDVFAGHPLMFAASDICLKRGGFGDSFKLGLAQDLVMGDTTNHDNYAVHLLGNAEGRTDEQKTVLSWTCKGFEYLQLAGKVVFPRKVLIPENEQGVRSTLATDLVEGSFNAKLTRSPENSFGFLSAVTFNKPFQFASLPGFGVKVEDAVFDLSEADNAASMVFPEGYSAEPAASTSEEDRTRQRNTWTGFYLKEMSFRLPNDFRNAQGERMAAGIQNVLIDKEGFSGKLFWDKLVNTGGMPDSGRVNICYFTLDQLTISILKNDLKEGKMTGKLGLPIFENNRTQYLAFEGLLGENRVESQVPNQPARTDGYNFTFTVSPPANTDLKIKMWDIAKMEVGRSSFIKLQIGQKPGVAFSLSGKVKFDGQPDGFPVGIQIPGLEVENMAFSTIEGDAHRNEFQLASLKVGDQVVWGHTDSSTPTTGATTPSNGSSRGGPNAEDGSTWVEGSGGGAAVGGFPIQIKKVCFATMGDIVVTSGGQAKTGEMKLTIHVRMRLADVLVVDELDITVKAGVTLDISKGVTKPDLSFSFKGFDPPTTVKVSGEIGGVALAGCIKFTKTKTLEGLAGGIRATIPMLGVIGVSAEFGTAGINTNEAYNYFNVQALFRSEQGITIFSGINLYGLSGGVWHHMKKTSILQPVPAQLTPQSGAPPVDCNSLIDGAGVIFTPDKTVALGLNFRAYFGCTGNSTVYNFDVGLAAEVKENVGLSMIEIDGNLYVMKDMGSQANNGNLRIQAKADFKWSKSQNGSEVIGASFQLSVLLKAGDLNLIYGNQQGDKYIAADIVFHSEKFSDGRTGDWFLKMGDPFHPQKSGLGIDLFGLAQANINTYLYTGKSTTLPTGLPDLPNEVAVLMGATFTTQGDNGASNLTSSSQEELAALRATNRTGFGVGFGFHFGADVDLNFLIFYAKMGIYLGMDVTMSEYPQGYCGTSSGSEWYAQGQAYAGIEAELGVKVDLFFIKGNFPIVSLGAGVALRAGLPNPAYFIGMVGMNYNILGGMVSGRCNFKIDIGEKCPASNPLSQVQFIDDLKPDNSSREISLYTQVGASFSYPMQKLMELVDDKGATRKFRPVLKSLVLKKDNQEIQSVGQSSLAADGFSVSFKPRASLDVNTPYTLVCTVGFNELANGDEMPFKDSTGHEFTESKTATFTTTPVRPDKLSEENISHTWPVRNQRFFLPTSASPIHNSGNERGVVALQAYENANVFRKGVDDRIVRFGPSVGAFSYYVRIVSPTGKVSEQDITTQVAGMRPEQIIFNVPATLQPETIHNMQLVRKGIERRGEIIMVASTTSGPLRQIYANSKLANDKEDGNLQETVNANSAEQRTNTLKLPDEDTPPDETVLYSYYFRTSKFQSPAQKLAKATLQNFRDVVLGAAYGDLYLDEALDEFDVNGIAALPQPQRFPIFSLNLASDDPVKRQAHGYTNGVLLRLAQSTVVTYCANDISRVGHAAQVRFNNSVITQTNRFYPTTASTVRTWCFGNYCPVVSRLVKCTNMIERAGGVDRYSVFNFPLENLDGLSNAFTLGRGTIEPPLSNAEIRAAYGDNSMLLLSSIVNIGLTSSLIQQLAPATTTQAAVATTPTPSATLTPNTTPSQSATNLVTYVSTAAGAVAIQRAVAAAPSSQAVASSARSRVNLSPGATFTVNQAVFASAVTFALPANKYEVYFLGLLRFNSAQESIRYKLDAFTSFLDVYPPYVAINFTNSSPGIFSLVNDYLSRPAINVPVNGVSSHTLDYNASVREIFGTQRKITLQFGTSTGAKTITVNIR